MKAIQLNSLADLNQKALLHQGNELTFVSRSKNKEGVHFVFHAGRLTKVENINVDGSPLVRLTFNPMIKSTTFTLFHHDDTVSVINTVFAKQTRYACTFDNSAVEMRLGADIPEFQTGTRYTGSNALKIRNSL